MMEDYNGSELPGPDTSQLARRGALVPPKMDEEDDYDEEVVRIHSLLKNKYMIIYIKLCFHFEQK